MLAYAFVDTGTINEIKEDDVRKTRSCVCSWISAPASWRFGIVAGAVCSSVVLLINLSTAIWAISALPVKNGQVTAFEGSCSKSKRLNLAIHLLINALGAILLGASNYCMQCLCAPTRTEIDKAHRKMIWLDIGVLSFRNLTHISRKRCVLWVCIALSSLPLHLFYNSAFYQSAAANQYSIHLISTDLIFAAFLPSTPQSDTNPTEARLVDSVREGHFEKLDRLNCLENYGNTFQASYGDVWLVVNAGDLEKMRNTTAVRNITHIVIEPGCDMSGWICNSTCDRCDQKTVNELKIGGGPWMVDHNPVEYCLSERTEEKCRIRFSIQIAVIVIIMNIVKVVIFTFVAFKMSDLDPLMNIGDAIASFIKTPDITTEGMCLVSRSDFEKRKVAWPRNSRASFSFEKPKRWSNAVSTKQWVLVMLLFGTVLIICIAFAMTTTNLSTKSFNTSIPSLRALSKGTGGLLGQTLAANICQLVLSFIYVIYNTVLTKMLLAKEWDQYATQRKGLRVSSKPKGAQRSTYFLQLPYRYGIPLLVMSGIFHWLISQTIFMVSVETFKSNGTVLPHRDNKTSVNTYAVVPVPANNILTTAYSTSGLYALMPLIAVTLLTIMITGRRIFISGMPVAGSCSAAISAACHTSSEEPDDATERGVMWGAFVEPNLWGGSEHCGFSSLKVSQPENDHMYVGLRKTT
ncbi:hypothetical protein BKA66DRAFT_149201 [Pyrenochaeta sp. MPI-SDFR-AT-0127]|nr:hypothetical protein BKA66DRAFT_149201 [Pyrenochaeta sp. MPI-SDFR-AT-0127]